MEINFTEAIIFGAVQIGFLIATIATVREKLKSQNQRIDHLAARSDVFDLHRTNSDIHQSSMPVREIQSNFDILREGQRVISSRLTDHINDDRVFQNEIRQELMAIRTSQAAEFKIIRETLDDFRDRLPRLPQSRD